MMTHTHNESVLLVLCGLPVDRHISHCVHML